jgi:hypothetical protein
MLLGIVSVGLVVRLEEDDMPDEPAVFPDVDGVTCELVQPAPAIAQQMRKITTMNALAFISDDKGIALFVRYDLLALWKSS